MWSNLALTYITVPTCKIGKNTIWTEFVGHWLQQFNTHVFPYEGLLSHFTNLKQFFRNIYWIIAELDHLAQPDWEHKLPFRDSGSILPVKGNRRGSNCFEMLYALLPCKNIYMAKSVCTDCSMGHNSPMILHVWQKVITADRDVARGGVTSPQHMSDPFGKFKNFQ